MQVAPGGVAPWPFRAETAEEEVDWDEGSLPAVLHPFALCWLLPGAQAAQLQSPLVVSEPL